jgi:hypothetical protein
LDWNFGRFTMTAITHASHAPSLDLARVRNLLHRAAYRVAQGLLAYGALMPLLVQEGARPSVPGVAIGAVFVLTMLILPRPERSEEAEAARRNAPPLIRALHFLV